MKHIVCILLFTVIAAGVHAQDAECKVLLDSIKGTYTGDCKDGKANGTGKSVGLHTYDGEFKKGLPEGQGKYTWGNGEYYYGGWKKGMKEGKGEMHSFENGVEKRLTGYWKKDKYSGLYEQPYRIINTTTEIGRVEVSPISKNGRSITITAKGLMDRSSGAGSPNGIITMTSFQIIRGTYTTKSNNKLTNSDVTIFRDVEFPFMATFNFGTAQLQIEIFEAGDWDVQVPVSK